MKRTTLALAALLMLAGCASVSPDAGQQRVQQLLEPHLKPPRQKPSLQQPLDVDAAVHLALQSHRGLQARLAEVGITEAEIVQASIWPNPGFSFGRTRRGDEREIERSLHLNLARLLLRPWQRELDERRLHGAQLQAAAQVLQHAADTRRAWIHAVAAEESLHYAQQVMQAAQASAELARRMAAVGNFNTVAAAREQAFEAEATLLLARATHQRTATRERLVRLLGLWGDEAATLQLPARLPPLPQSLPERPGLEQLAVAQRLDMAAAREQVQATARSLGLVRASGFVNVLELGLVHNSSNEAPVQRGWELSFELPIFDWGQARVPHAERVYTQALHHAAQTAIDARSEVREAWSAWRHAHDIARHQFETLVPLRQRINQENLLRYNGMLIGVFELLADTRAQIAGVSGAIDALRDFWLAEADLEQALVGRPALAPLAATATAPAAGGAAH
jgi:outer membrane protein TolC